MITVSRGEVYPRTWIYDGRERKAYQFSLTVVEDGVTRRVRGQAPTRAEALADMDAKREDLLKPKPIAAPAPVTLAQAFEKLLALKARKRTLRQFESIARHLKAAFGPDTPLVAITADRISDYKAARIAEGLSPAGVNRPLELLRHLLRQALRWKWISEMPESERERESQGRLRWLTPEDAVRLLDACRKRSATLADLVELTMLTGLRKGEALGLEWERVDRARGVIRLEVTKSGHRREVPLCGPADAVLARRATPDAQGLVFGCSRWPAFRYAFDQAVKEAKLDDFRFHDLRHTAASWLVQRGCTLKEVQEFLGHKSIAMTMRYSHLSPDHLRVAVARLDNVLPAAPVAQAQHGHNDSQPRPASIAPVREVRVLAR
jgi:integrase